VIPFADSDVTKGGMTLSNHRLKLAPWARNCASGRDREHSYGSARTAASKSTMSKFARGEISPILAGQLMDDAVADEVRIPSALFGEGDVVGMSVGYSRCSAPSPDHV
jgi:hypothetical protein